MNRWLGLALLLIVAGALALRSPQLALRPMHNDEAVNAEKIKGLWQTGKYTYDPNEHHGPTLFYATLPFVWLSGAPDYDHLTEITLRAVSVFFCLLLILLLYALADGLGPLATLSAALLTAISPAMVFYSRYFIHEMLLVCFTLLLILAGWRYSRNPKITWAAMGGLGLGLMYATKETFIIPVAALAGALLLSFAWDRWHSAEKAWRVPHLNRAHLLIAAGTAAFVALVFFTSFFTNAHGPLDSLRTYVPWLKRAGGDSPHIHSWTFYLERLLWFKPIRSPLWSEGLVAVLALIGGWAAFTGKGLAGIHASLVRFLTLYTVLLTTAYSVISYKTPWCMLGFLQPLILIAGVGAAVLLRASPRRWVQAAVALGLLAAATQLTWQAWRASYPFAADRRNPYVYAQTVPNVLRLVEQVHALGRVHADGSQMLLKVMAPDSDYWPLPWSLRAFKRIGWWDRVPADPFAPVMIVGAKLKATLDERSDYKWRMVGIYELRPQTFLELYVEYNLWAKFVQSRPPPPEE